MDISSLYSIGSSYIQEAAKTANVVETDGESSFSAIYQSALEMLNETSALENSAQEEELKWAMGLTESAALTYTVAVRDKVLDAYKEIMNMQM